MDMNGKLKSVVEQMALVVRIVLRKLIIGDHTLDR